MAFPEVHVGRPSRRLDRLFVCFLACALLAGCGDDDEPAPREPARSETAATAEATEAETATATETTPKREKESPEQQQGGAGDEVPARSLALLTGRGGRITPRVVRVPPFIAIRVELRSDDGRAYGLQFPGERLGVSGGVTSVSTTLDGLRPGRAYTGRPLDGAANGVRIEASAEPGP